MSKLTSIESQVLFGAFPELRAKGYLDPAQYDWVAKVLTSLLRKRYLLAEAETGRMLLTDRGLAYMKRAIVQLDDPHEEDEYPDWDYKRDLMRLIGYHHYTVDMGNWDETTWALTR